MKNFLKAVGYFAAALAFVLSAVFLSAKISPNTPQNSNINTSNQNTNVPVAIRPEVSCLPDILSYQALRDNSGLVVPLIGERKSMFASNGSFVNSQVVITKNETAESKVACGYLLVRAGTQSHGALQSWENLYINPSGFGGHINIGNQFGVGDGENYSEYLFSLNDIEYWKNRAERAKGNLQKADWAALLNVQNSVTFDIALNTEDKSGFIDELSIAYKCWNPKTGAENQDCKINVTGSTDTESPSLK